MLRKRIGILKRIKQKIPADKLSIIADAIFNSVIRYGIAVYLVPTYEKEIWKQGNCVVKQIASKSFKITC